VITDPTILAATILIAACLCAVAFFARWILNNPRRDELDRTPSPANLLDVIDAGLLYRATQLLAAFLHQLRVHNPERIPRGRRIGPLVVVANHTAGVDPLLIQAACEFEIRWMMARDMMSPTAAPLWSLTRVIPVDRDGRDTSSVRAALKHLAAGGVIGIFPEGAIARPRPLLKPFHHGVGLIVARANAPVLPIIIEGTPDAPTANASILRPSRSRLRILPMVTFPEPRDAAAITADLEALFARETSWPRGVSARAPAPSRDPAHA
jgi:1-acyl-sn-glycerol-3-phosphate acyltransferase